MNDLSVDSSPTSIPRDEHSKLELQECFVAIRGFLERRTQLVVFFGTANLTLLGLAIRYQNSAAIMGAGLLLAFFIVVDTIIRKNITSYLYTSYCIESENPGKHGLVYHHILSHTGGLVLLKELEKLRIEDEPETLHKKLRGLLLNPFGFRSLYVTTIVAGVALIEVPFSLFMNHCFDWPWLRALPPSI